MTERPMYGATALQAATSKSRVPVRLRDGSLASEKKHPNAARKAAAEKQS